MRRALLATSAMLSRSRHTRAVATTTQLRRSLAPGKDARQEHRRADRSSTETPRAEVWQHLQREAPPAELAPPAEAPRRRQKRAAARAATTRRTAAPPVDDAGLSRTAPPSPTPKRRTRTSPTKRGSALPGRLDPGVGAERRRRQRGRDHGRPREVLRHRLHVRTTTPSRSPSPSMRAVASSIAVNTSAALQLEGTVNGGQPFVLTGADAGSAIPFVAAAGPQGDDDGGEERHHRRHHARPRRARSARPTRQESEGQQHRWHRDPMPDDEA